MASNGVDLWALDYRTHSWLFPAWFIYFELEVVKG